jgi:predicted  nucleic acid-binding Zn-ribbon protein
MGPHPSNETGHWEPETLVAFNDEILEAAGSEWDDWGPCFPGGFQSLKTEAFKERAVTIFDGEFGSSRLMVFKDPRICRIMPFWLEVLDDMEIQPLVIIPFRNPLEVAKSLRVRDESDEQYNLLLWLRHVLDAEHASRGLPRFFSLYDNLISDWSSVVNGAQNALGIKWPRVSARVHEEIDALVSDEFRHHTISAKQLVDNPSVSAWFRDAFQILLKWDGTSGNEADFKTLDDIRRQLNCASDVFGRLVYKRKHALAEQTKLISARDAHIVHLDGVLGEVKSANHDLSQQNEILSRENEEVRRQNIDLVETVSSLRQEFESKVIQAETTRVALEKNIAELAESVSQLELSNRVQLDSIRIAEREVENYRQELQRTQSALHQRNAEADDLHQEVGKLSDQIVHLDADLDRARRKVNDLQVDLEIAIRDIEGKSGLILELQTQIDHELAENGQLRQEYNSLSEDSRVVAEQLSRLANAMSSRRLWPYFRYLMAKRIASQLKASGVVDEDWYRQKYSDVAGADMDPYLHFAQFGAAEGRSPSPLVDKIRSC